MGYLHIENLYKDQEILTRCTELAALEKVHGTSAHIGPEGKLFSGGVSPDSFAELFTEKDFTTLDATIYGEAYGGKCQGMSESYGKELKFIAFDVFLIDKFLDVADARSFCDCWGIEFVPWEVIPATIEACNRERDRDSLVAVTSGKMREGVVLRPLNEMKNRWKRRLIAKHKRPEFSETKTIREVDPAKQAALIEAEKVADEFVTEMRLTHVLDKLSNPTDISAIPTVIKAMVEDVCREGAGEFEPSREVLKTIGSRAALLFKRRISNV